MTKRTSYDIVAEILGVLHDGQECLITHVQYQANMGTVQFEHGYKKLLVEKGFIKERIDRRNRYLRITEKGRNWLTRFLSVKEELYGQNRTRKD